MSSKSKNIRRLDSLGRVVIPMGIKNNLGIRTGTPLIILQEGERIVITKDTDTCYFCGSDESLQKYDSRFLCEKCIDRIIMMKPQLNQSQNVS